MKRENVLGDCRTTTKHDWCRKVGSLHPNKSGVVREVVLQWRYRIIARHFSYDISMMFILSKYLFESTFIWCLFSSSLSPLHRLPRFTACTLFPLCGLPTDPSPPATAEIVELYNNLRSKILLLYDLRLVHLNCEFELQAARWRLDTFAPDQVVGLRWLWWWQLCFVCTDVQCD